MATYNGQGIIFSRVARENPNNEQYRLHVHDDYELLCPISGRVGYLVEGHSYDMKPGCLMIMRSAESHRLVVKGSERYERYTLNFRPEQLTRRGFSEELLAPFTHRELGERNLYAAAEFGGLEPLRLFRQMEESCETVGVETAGFACLATLLCALHSAYLRQPDPIEITDELGRELLDFVNENLCSELSLASVSEAVHMSPSQINRVFHRLTGTSVYHYALSKRLVIAQGRLAQGETATSVAQSCGFRDYSSFYRLYKKRFGTPPSSARDAWDAKDAGMRGDACHFSFKKEK